MSRPPCEFRPEYTSPGSFPKQIQQEAKDRCEECPLLQQCAEAALTSGGTLDRQRITPATGVIQAGVYCKGDRDTAKQLATIAGITLPATEHHPRFVPPNHCEGCGKYMTTRDKTQPVKPDVLTHSSHGYCRICDAKRRRHPDWQPPQPRHATLLEGKQLGHRMGLRNRRHTAGDNPAGTDVRAETRKGA